MSTPLGEIFKEQVRTPLLAPGSSTMGRFKIEKPATRQSFLNVLVYGDSGVGKTRLAGTSDDVPSMRKVLIVDIEGGTFTLRNSNPNVDVVRIESWLEMQDLYNEFYAGNTGYNTVVLDSLTEIQKFNMYHILKGVVRDEPSRDEDIASMREWGKNLEQMRKFVRAWRDLPVNVIMTALAKSDKDSKTGIITKKPYLSGKLADEVTAFLDIVVYMYTKEVDGQDGPQRLLLTGATEKFIAKDRSGRLPLVVESPTMPQLHEIIFKEQTND